jgi:hypothetical protein
LDSLSLLVELATSPGLLEQYESDPESVLAKTAISENERQALLSGDRERISALFPQSLSEV